MVVKTRLDAVVKVKERSEEKAGQALAKAEQVVQSANAKLESAKALAAQDHRARGDISQWEVGEMAHHKAISDARRAERDLLTAKKSANVVRAEYISAHQAAEVVRRVADSRRNEIVAEQNRAEDKALDEAASMLFFRKAG